MRISDWSSDVCSSDLVIESEGRSWPLDLRHIGRAAEKRIEDDMAAAIRHALEEECGDLLAFLPGVAEIERTAERLDGLPPTIVVHKLQGYLDPAEQTPAIRPVEAGRQIGRAAGGYSM